MDLLLPEENQACRKTRILCQENLRANYLNCAVELQGGQVDRQQDRDTREGPGSNLGPLNAVRRDLWRVHASPCTSVSPYSFVWLVCLIWNLFEEGHCTLCVQMGHWHLSSPCCSLLGDKLEVFVSSPQRPCAPPPPAVLHEPISHTSATGRSIRGTTQHPSAVSGGIWHFLLFQTHCWYMEGGTLNICFTAWIGKDASEQQLQPLEWYWESVMSSAGTKCGSAAWKALRTGICMCVYVGAGMGACVVLRSRVKPRASTPAKPPLFLSAPSHSSPALSVANVQSHLSNVELPKIIKTQQSLTPCASQL